MLLSLYSAAKPVFEGRVSAIIDTVWSLWTVATIFVWCRKDVVNTHTGRWWFKRFLLLQEAISALLAM